MTKTIISLAIIFVGFTLLKDRVVSINGDDYTARISQFVSLENTDEYVIATLKTSEYQTDIHCVETIFSQCILPTQVEVNPDVFYKYFIKLSELRYSLLGDTLQLEIPGLYLSTPVAVDAASLEHRCNSLIPHFNCKATFNHLMDELSSMLNDKGIAQRESIREKAAKSLTDNIHTFLKNQDTRIGYKNISVSFNDESGSPEHFFKFNDSYCGPEQCKAEIVLGNNRRLILK